MQRVGQRNGEAAGPRPPLRGQRHPVGNDDEARHRDSLPGLPAGRCRHRRPGTEWPAQRTYRNANGNAWLARMHVTSP